jgi:fumarate reductase subunit D
VHSLTNIRLKSPATLGLIGIVLASAIIYILAFLIPANLLTHYSQPRLDLFFLSRKITLANVRLIIGFVVLGLLYWGGYQLTRYHASGRVAWIIVVSGMVVFCTIFIFVAPFDAADIYDNIMHGRITGIYNASPFRQVIADYPQDPFYEYTAWKHSQSAYGPLWEMLAGFTARFAGDEIIPNVITFKFLPGLFHLASVGIVFLYLRAKAPEKALCGVLLLGWNPVLLYETWGNGHNDMVMTFWILASLWWVCERHYTLAVLSLLLGALVKFIPVLLIPIVVVVGWHELGKISLRLSFLAKTAIGGGLLTALLYFPFWEGLSTLDIGRRMKLFTTSLPSVAQKALTPYVGGQTAGKAVSLIALGLLLLFVIYQSLFAEKSIPSNDYLRATFNILSFYLMVSCLWFHQWYGLWLITLAPLLTKERRQFALLFGFWILSKQLLFVPLFVPKIIKAPPGQAAWFEALLTLGVLGVPWLFALRDIWKHRRMRRAYHAA